MSFGSFRRHDIENSKQIFQEKELRGHSPNSHIRVSVNDLYIPTTGLPFLLQENTCGPILVIHLNCSQAKECGVEIGTEGVHFLFWEYIMGIFVAVLQLPIRGAAKQN
jgi:hypothetical protein